MQRNRSQLIHPMGFLEDDEMGLSDAEYFQKHEKAHRFESQTIIQR